jgi:hypothetical protein
MNVGVPKTLVKLPKLSQKSTPLSTFTDQSTLQTTVGGDHEEQANWTALMSRTIDLEGICEDAFGYTVTITGPPRAARQRKRWRQVTGQSERSKEFSMEPSSALSTGKSQGSTSKSFEVVTSNTFEVADVYRDRDIIQKPPMLPNAFHEGQGEFEFYESGAGAVDWTLLDTPEVVTALPEIRRR